jgi:hypothetical protein
MAKIITAIIFGMVVTLATIYLRSWTFDTPALIATILINAAGLAFGLSKPLVWGARQNPSSASSFTLHRTKSAGRQMALVK